VSKFSAKSREYRAYWAEQKAACKAAGRLGVCWICHRRIDCDLKAPDPRSFSLDHADAQADAADPNTVRRDRLKWSHLGCNSRRGDGTNRAANRTSVRW
jgi:hypothetical protein